MSLYSVWHHKDLFSGISIIISISHTYCVAKWHADPFQVLYAYILQQMNDFVNKSFAKFIMYVTVQCLACQRFVQWA